MNVQNIRDFQRPYMTMLFSTSYVICIIIILVAVIHKAPVNKLTELVPVLIGIAGLIGTPLGAIMGYHFAKSTMKDSTKIKTSS